MRLLKVGLSLTVAALLGVLARGTVHAQTGEASARTVFDQAAEALGGAARVRSVKNITLVGYGQYAYMFGGGRGQSGLTPFSVSS